MGKGARSNVIQKERDSSKLTKQKIASLLLMHFSTEVEIITTTKKVAIVEIFNAFLQQNPILLLDESVHENERLESEEIVEDSNDNDDNECHADFS